MGGHPPDPGLRISVLGYAPVEPRDILEAARAGRDWTGFPGDYTVIAEAEGEAHVVTSTIAAKPYFYCHSDGHFLHGANVFELAARTRRPFRWDERSLQSLALVGHCWGDRTLHAAIRRVPAGHYVRWNGNLVMRRAKDEDQWSASAARAEERLEQCLDSLESAFRDLPSGPLNISLSAGLDSRLLLALSLKHRPPQRAICMGRADTTDLQVASQLAERAGVPLAQVQLEPEDYVQIAHAASWATGGSKTAQNWHTGIYPMKAGLSEKDIHLVGSNGEFARSFFLPQTRLPELALLSLSGLPAGALTGYWAARVARRRLRFAREWSFLGAGAVRATIAAIDESRCSLPAANDLGDQLDFVYALVRVRQFIGNGLALYSFAGQPCSPFLDSRWLQAAFALPRQQKLFDRFHRWALGMLRAGDLDLPFNGHQYRANGRPQRISKVRGFSAFAAAIDLPVVRERLVEDKALDRFLPRVARERVVRRRATDDIDLLWTLSAAAECVRLSEQFASASAVA